MAARRNLGVRSQLAGLIVAMALLPFYVVAEPYWIEVVDSSESATAVAPENQLQVLTLDAAPAGPGEPTMDRLREGENSDFLNQPANQVISQSQSVGTQQQEAPAAEIISNEAQPVKTTSDKTQTDKTKAESKKAEAQAKAEARVEARSEVKAEAKVKATQSGATAPTRDRSRRTREVEVFITGLDGRLEKNARVYLTLIRKDSVVRSRYQLRRLVAKGRDEIAEALEAYGYYNAELTSDIDPDPPEGSPNPDQPWRVRYTVDPGPQVMYDGFKVQVAGPGAKVEEVQQAVTAVKIKTGDPLIHPEYEAEKRRILAAARDEGYIDAKYALSELRVNPGTNKVAGLLRMSSGALFEFGQVTLDQDVLNDDLVQAFVPFKAGDRFDSDKLIELQLALNDTRYFSRVEVDVDRDAAVPETEAGTYESLDGSQQPSVMRLPVNVLLSPGKHRSYKAGFGYGTDTGGRVSLGYENRRVNKAGHQLNAETRVSELSSEIAVRYSLPVVNKGTDRLAFDNSYKNERPADEGELVRQRSELRLERVKPRLRRSVYVAFEREKFELGDDKGSSKLLIPGFGISWVNTTNRLRPKFGLALSANVHGAAEGFLTDTTFLQFTTSGDSVWSFTSRWRLIGRTKLVYSVLGADFNTLPASQRQFAGGTGSVRGFGYQELAPRDDSGDVIGGRHLSTFTGELEYQFANSWAVAAFSDSGNAGPQFLKDLQTSVGLGLRWLLPFGQIRFDVAQPITGDDDQVRFHLSLGPDL